MSIQPIVVYPDKRLMEKSADVEGDFSELKSLLQDMTDTMYASRGAGLAAIQIGVPKNIFIIDPEVAGLDPKDPPVVFINPEFISLSDEKEKTEEGCLSFPGVFISVERSYEATMKALDRDGNPFEVSCSGLYARALQHEFDHLNGQLLIDMAGRLKKKMIEKKMRKEAAAK